MVERAPRSRRHDGQDSRERWNARYASSSAPDEPATFLTERAHLLPGSGAALDLAGGAGRNAVWLARHGLRVTLVDLSDEACVAARRRAVAAGVELDIERRELGSDPLPAGPFDVVLCHHYLDVQVWRDAASRVRPGGLLLVCQPTVRNLERHDRPPRRWLLEEGELAQLAASLGSFEVIELAEDWTDDGRHEAHAVLRSAAGRTAPVA